MLDPRIYRAGFIAVAMAVIVVAFSLVDQQGPLTTTLAPDAFTGQNAFAMMNSLAAANPDRRPGGPGDDDVASTVAGRLRSLGYGVTTDLFTERTARGTRTLENVIGTRPGLGSGSIVIVSHRDAEGVPAAAELSGTATMLELGRVLSGESQHHTIVLASTSGSAGAAGATRLARTLPRPIDAVIALGDVASSRPLSPVVIPFSTGGDIAPPVLRNTVAAALGAQAGVRPGGTGIAGQLAHLAVPMTLGEQAPFGARGIPAVTVSLSGDHPAGAGRDPSSAQMNGVGRGVLQAIYALDGASTITRARPYMLFSGKVVPDWALRLLVLALLVPVLPAAVDGFARVRRRGHPATGGIVRTLGAAVPFLAALLVIIAARLLGVLHAVPPGPVGSGAVPVDGAGVAVLVVCALALAGGVTVWARAGGTGPGRGPRAGLDPGGGAGTLIVLCLSVLVLWWLNPFAAILMVPAVHLWMWLLDAELRPHPLVSLALILAGVALPVLIVVAYAGATGLGVGGVVWNGLLLLAGGALPVSVAVLWCVLLGCLCAVVHAAAATARSPRPEQAPVTVRGPVTYAGPGSLGGTRSALRR